MQYSIFFALKGDDYPRETIISYTAHWKSYPKYCVSREAIIGGTIIILGNTVTVQLKT